MRFGRRRRGGVGARPHGTDCEHLWRTRQVTTTLDGSAYRVCDLCGAVRVDDGNDDVPDAAGPPAVGGLGSQRGSEGEAASVPPPEWSPQHAAGQGKPPARGV